MDLSCYVGLTNAYDISTFVSFQTGRNMEVGMPGGFGEE